MQGVAKGSRAASGLFITLYDNESLELYLRRGIFGSLMRPLSGLPKPDRVHHVHSATLADYGCTRPGTHIFFFQQRRIVYGGPILAPNPSIGAFVLNGPQSPLGCGATAPLVWDEGTRARYTNIGAGTFLVPIGDEPVARNQPYLLRFDTSDPLSRRVISSDDLYFEIGIYGIPLPSNAIQGMSFCTLTPAETEKALELFARSSESFTHDTDAGTVLNETALQHFDVAPDRTNVFDRLRDRQFYSEADLEAAIVSDPMSLPTGVWPGELAAVCRQVPICPFKPAQLDRADICLYLENSPQPRFIPDVVIELKKEVVSNAAIDQVVRYLDWLVRVRKHIRELYPELVQVIVIGRRKAKRLKTPERYDKQIEIVTAMEG